MSARVGGLGLMCSSDYRKTGVDGGHHERLVGLSLVYDEMSS